MYLGIMTGTSLDGINIAIAEFFEDTFTVHSTGRKDLPASIITPLKALIAGEPITLKALGALEQIYTHACAIAVLDLLKAQKLDACKIKAIGFHGQTIWHAPNGPHPFTWQMGDPGRLAVETQIPVIADFRRKDMAAGGQGAPLAPLFHRYCFRSAYPAVILNLGGIANITVLTATHTHGFDTGPANTLLDQWTQLHRGQPYDHAGEWARTGVLHLSLLDKMLEDPYFKQSPPKSTGREYFHLRWLQHHLDAFPSLSAESVQATLTELTAVSVAQAIRETLPSAQIYVAGGGSANQFLMERLRAHLPEANYPFTKHLSVDPDAIEALLMAYLAYCHVQGLPGNIPGVTGAHQALILGGYYHAK